MINRIKVKIRRWWRKQLISQNPYLSQMETSNCRFEFLLDQLAAATIAKDFEQSKRIRLLMNLESDHFRRVTDKSRKLLRL